MDETTFKLFEVFDFENDERFQAGWNSIEKLIDPQRRGSEYLRAQAFFFSKNVRAFDYQQYLQWRNRTQIVRPEADEAKSRGKLDCSAGDIHDGKEKSQDVNILSLADIAELIQNNQPIPGIVSVCVKPSNTDPTPSKMMRKLKPWEMTESSCSNNISEPQKPTVLVNFSDSIS